MFLRYNGFVKKACINENMRFFIIKKLQAKK